MAEQSELDFGSKPADLKRAAEESLEVAQRLAQRKDPSAGLAFRDAERLAVRCADMEMQTRVFESSGDFYGRQAATARALEKYNVAMQNAQCLSVTSDPAIRDVDRLRYKCLNLQNLGNRQFKNLEDVAQPTDPYRVRCKAWFSFTEEAERPAGRLAARGLGSKEDFRRRLDAAKLDTGDDEDDD